MPFLGNIGTGELFVIAIVLMVLFGSKKANELAKGLGESKKEAKRIQKEFEAALKDEPEDTLKQPQSQVEELAKQVVDEGEKKEGAENKDFENKETKA